VAKEQLFQKNVVILNDSLDGGITACRHGNGRDVVITHGYENRLYYKFLVSPLGISSPDSQNIGAIRNIDLGQMTFSPDGHKMVYTSLEGT